MLKPFYERQEILNMIQLESDSAWAEVNEIDDEIDFPAICSTPDTFHSEDIPKM